MKKKSKLRIILELWFWGFVHFWQAAFSRSPKPSVDDEYEALIQRLKDEEKEKVRQQDLEDLREILASINWFKLIFYPLVYLSVLASIVFVFVVLINIILAFIPGPKIDLTDPKHLIGAPTAQVIRVTPEMTPIWWDEEIDSWLSSFDSAQLREEKNVVNFVLLSPDYVRYAANQTFRLDEGWTQSRPPFVETVSIDGTEVVVQLGGIQYNLNVRQPFTLATWPGTIVMIDENGVIWNLSSQQAHSVQVGSFELPFSINPNSDLPIGFTKQ